MKRLTIVVFFLLACVGVVLRPDTASAASIRLQPLQYSERLATGEKKKGFIDVSNPSDQLVRVTTSVQAFRQVNDHGGLSFYEDEQVAAGIIPDLKAFELGPKDTMRLFFLVDGTKLPNGDVFGVLFVTASPPKETLPITQSARVGTLFSLVNGTPGPRNAHVEQLNTSFFQFGKTIRGSYAIKNTADSSKATGFYPKVSVGLSPFGSSTESTGSLVFAGHTRTNNIAVPSGNRFGLYTVTVSYRDSVKSKAVFVVAGWGWLVVVIVISGVLGVRILQRQRKRRVDFSQRR